MRAPRLRHAALEIRQPVCNGDAEASRRRVVLPVELLEHVDEISTRTADVAGADVRGHELVMARRDDYLHVVVHDLRDAVEQMLLARTVERDRPRRRVA